MHAQFLFHSEKLIFTFSFFLQVLVCHDMRYFTDVDSDMMNIHNWLADEDQSLPNMFNKASFATTYPAPCAIASQSNLELDTYQVGTKFNKNPPSYEEHMKRYNINQSLGSNTSDTIKNEYQSIGNYSHSLQNQAELMEPYRRETRNMCYPCKYRAMTVHKYNLTKILYNFVWLEQFQKQTK